MQNLQKNWNLFLRFQGANEYQQNLQKNWNFGETMTTRPLAFRRIYKRIETKHLLPLLPGEPGFVESTKELKRWQIRRPDYTEVHVESTKELKRSDRGISQDRGYP